VSRQPRWELLPAFFTTKVGVVQVRATQVGLAATVSPTGNTSFGAACIEVVTTARAFPTLSFELR
jgi:hypothetical protein